jgi:hypothetical protein
MDCPECNRLWRAYAKATRRHLTAVRAFEAAAESEDILTMRAMEVQGAELAANRRLARRAIGEHEAAAHARVSSPAAKVSRARAFD